MTTNDMMPESNPSVTRSWTRGAASSARIWTSCATEKIHVKVKSLRNGIIAGLAAIVSAIAPEKAEGVSVSWGTPYQTSGGNTAINLQVINDNQGTSYTSAQINSLMQLFTLYGITDPAGTTGGKKNVGLTINSGSGYVNEGWNASINYQGQISINYDQGNPFGDSFNFGDVFFLTVGFNNDYLVGLGKDPNNVVLGQNSWGLNDVAMDAYGGDYNTQTPLVPVPEPATGALALAGAAMLLRRRKRQGERVQEPT